MQERPNPAARADGAELDELVFECLERVETDGREAVDALCAAHPAQAERLRSRLELLESSGLFALSPSSADGLPERLCGARLVERLGSGASGVVYRAEQRSAGRELALKIPWPFALTEREVHRRFHRELELARGLRHPNLVPIREVGESDGVSFAAFDYLRGTSLERVLAELGARTPASLSAADWRRGAGRSIEGAADGTWVRSCLSVVHGLASALSTVHAAGLSHGRVRPWNVLLTVDGRIVLLDLGFGCLAGRSASVSAHRVQHDARYAAPEARARSAPAASAAGDVYALGALLHELTTLRLPGRPGRVSMRACNADVDGGLEAVALQALEREPGLRYADAAELAGDLERLLDGRPVQARPIGWASRARHVCRRVWREAWHGSTPRSADPS